MGCAKWVCAWPLGLGWMSWFGAFGSGPPLAKCMDGVGAMKHRHGKTTYKHSVPSKLLLSARIHIEGLRGPEALVLGCLSGIKQGASYL